MLFAIRAALIRPGVEFFNDPGGGAHGAVHHAVRKRLRFRHLQTQVGTFEFKREARRCSPGFFFFRLGEGGRTQAEHIDVNGFRAATFER